MCHAHACPAALNVQAVSGAAVAVAVREVTHGTPAAVLVLAVGGRGCEGGRGRGGSNDPPRKLCPPHGVRKAQVQVFPRQLLLLPGDANRRTPVPVVFGKHKGVGFVGGVCNLYLESCPD